MVNGGKEELCPRSEARLKEPTGPPSAICGPTRYEVAPLPIYNQFVLDYDSGAFGTGARRGKLIFSSGAPAVCIVLHQHQGHSADFASTPTQEKKGPAWTNNKIAARCSAPGALYRQCQIRASN